MASLDEISVISDHAVEIYTWVSLVLICQLINIFGVVTNIINIICFVKQGFEDSVNVSMLGLSVSDLGSLITMIWSCICFIPSFTTTDMPFEPMEISYLSSAMLHFAFTRISGCMTAMITVERCLCITSPLKVKNIITSKRLAVITICIFLIFGFSGAPVYFVNSWAMKFSASRNRTIYGLVSTEHREQVEMITFAINNFIIPFSAFVIISVCTITISFKLRRSSKWRLMTVVSAQVDRVSTRNKKTATMVVMIACLFIVCFVPVCIVVLVVGLEPSLSLNGKYVKISYFIAGLVYIMESMNSSMNIFIYYHMSSKYRDCLCKIMFVLNIKPDAS